MKQSGQDMLVFVKGFLRVLSRREVRGEIMSFALDEGKLFPEKKERRVEYVMKQEIQDLAIELF